MHIHKCQRLNADLSHNLDAVNHLSFGRPCWRVMDEILNKALGKDFQTECIKDGNFTFQHCAPSLTVHSSLGLIVHSPVPSPLTFIKNSTLCSTLQHVVPFPAPFL